MKADIDTEDTARRLAAIASDKNLQNQIDDQQKKLQLLEEAIKRANTQIASATLDRATDLRKERNVVFADIADLEKLHMVAKKRIDEERNEECEIARKMQRYVLKGMTKPEVLKILGEPFKKQNNDWWIYGETSVAFEDYKSSPGGERVKYIFLKSPCIDSK